MEENSIFIVAGDEMLKLMKAAFPGRKAVPFREDLSKGAIPGDLIDEGFIRERAAFWGVSEADYSEKMRPVIDLDLSKSYTLCFGVDACCRANLGFLLQNLKSRGYSKPVVVRIVDERDLTLIKEYRVDPSAC